MVKLVDYELETELDERKIVGGYNTKSLMGFS